MHRFSNLGPLFLVEAGMDHEPFRLTYTCVAFEAAVSVAESYMADRGRSGYDDVVRVRAVQPGPGDGVVVARWYPERVYSEGATVQGPDGWQVEDDGPPTEAVCRWERVL